MGTGKLKWLSFTRPSPAGQLSFLDPIQLSFLDPIQLSFLDPIQLSFPEHVQTVPSCLSRSEPVIRSCIAAWLAWSLAVGTLISPAARTASGQDAGEEAAIAAYADAANFQTNGAFDLAIEGWETFLKRFPEHHLASKASHYLGVSHMQRDRPDYQAAARAFEKALQDKDSELREESFANRGWSLYASADRGPRDESDDQAPPHGRDTTAEERERLQEAIRTFDQLRTEKPETRFLDRAYFYSGEAAYALGNRQQAIDFYDQFLSLPTADKSLLRCETLYGRGVALEDLERYDEAVAAYRRLLESCDDGSLHTDTRMRLGDLMIRLDRHAEAVESFALALTSAETAEERAYALFRQGYALVRSERPGEAATTYEQLLTEYPESRYTAEATLASAQSTYRSGDMELAAERFEKVLAWSDAESATEAAHWLTRIRLSQGEVEQARDVAQRQIEAGATGAFAMALKLDLGEALSMQPDTVPQSLERFEQAYREAPDDPLASRALYNAAFSALQSSQGSRAFTLADEFLARFPDDVLAADVKFIAAEGRLAVGRHDEAATIYTELVQETAGLVQETAGLLQETAGDVRVQRPRWVLRAATAMNAAQRYDETVELLERELESQNLVQPAEQAQANFLLGQAHRLQQRHAEAASAFQVSASAGDVWAGSAQAALLAAQSLLAAQQRDAAAAQWESILEQYPQTQAADRARYQLAQLAGREQDYDSAVESYDEILASAKDPALRPYALYGRGWSLMQRGDHATAIESLDQALREADADHAIREDALLARGISRRNVGELAGAREDLEALLQQQPEGIMLGNALYELALVEQQARLPAAAAEHLRRLRNDVDDFPEMDRVRYELAWSLRDAGDEEGAAAEFSALIEHHPENVLVGEAAYFLGQRLYVEQSWQEAAARFEVAAARSDDPELAEKSLYRLGWSKFKLGAFEAAAATFRRQAASFPEGDLLLDAWMMIGESEFKQERFEAALDAYTHGRQMLRDGSDSAATLRDNAERLVREVILLHGGQSAAQLGQFEDAIEWFDELRERFPATAYLAQVFYETGYAYQQTGDDERALRLFGEVANNYRNEVAARARFMIGEIKFGDGRYEEAIPEFQRVMFGFGAEQAPDEIKNWQVKSGFEAGRCSEALMQNAKSDAAKRRSRELALTFYQYVVDKHPDHELAGKSRQRIEGLNKP